MTANLRSVTTRVAAGVAAMSLLLAVGAWAGPFTGALAGYEYSRGPLGQETRAALAVGTWSLGAADGFAQLAHFDDVRLGEGASLTLEGGLALEGALGGRARATRVFGDELVRGWLARLGPELRLTGGTSVAGYFEHYQPDAGGSWNGVVGEALVPVRPRLDARIATSYAAAGANARSAQASAGALWQAWERLLLTGEVGWAHIEGEFPGLQPTGGGLLSTLPVVGSAGQEGEDGTQGSARVRERSPTFLLGVRILFP